MGCDLANGYPKLANVSRIQVQCVFWITFSLQLGDQVTWEYTNVPEVMCGLAWVFKIPSDHILKEEFMATINISVIMQKLKTGFKILENPSLLV